MTNIEAGRGLSRFLLGLGLVLIAFDLRPLFSSFSTLLPELRTELGLSPAMAGILTTLPVVCLGAFSPLAPWLGQRLGQERTLLGVLMLLAVGTALRGTLSLPLMALGSVLAGGCIAVGNVLLPALVKRDFPDRTALMTGLYTMALCGGAAAAAGLTLPLRDLVGGSLGLSLGLWALPAIVVMLIWLPQAFGRASHGRRSRVRVIGLWRDRLAWQVTLFMGLQSALAYCVFGWLVPILRERGMDGVHAGALVSMSVMVQAAACIFAPQLAVRARDQRLINVMMALAAAVALIGLLFAPLWSAWGFAILQGIGQGSLIALAMTAIVLRSPNSEVAAYLSGMAQFVGYLLAAVGPLLVGVIRSWTGSFDWTAVLYTALGLGVGINGWGAGRKATVDVETISVDR